MIIGIDHGYYAIKTKQVCFPTGLMRYTYEPYTMQNVLQYGRRLLCVWDWAAGLSKRTRLPMTIIIFDAGCTGTGDPKTKGERTAKVVLAAGLPSCWVWKGKTEIQGISVSERTARPLFFTEGEHYEIQIEDVKLFPQGYSALALYPEYLKDEPSVLLCGYRRMDGGLDAS